MRTLPVRIDEFSITEEAFDTILNPIRAKVSLSLQVLNYQDLGLLSVGGAMFMVHQVIKEVMATINGVGSLGSIGSVASVGSLAGAGAAASGSFSVSGSVSLGG
jgi:hypothetical protein